MAKLADILIYYLYIKDGHVDTHDELFYKK